MRILLYIYRYSLSLETHCQSIQNYAKDLDNLIDKISFQINFSILINIMSIMF